MKQLPKAERNLKNFILGEDARIIDKTVTKVALVSVTLLISSCSPPSPPPPTHSNDLVWEITDLNMGNDGSIPYKNTVIVGDTQTLNVDVPPKTVQTVHANHYNSQPPGSSGYC